MQIDLNQLPDDAARLQQMLCEVVAVTGRQQAELQAENAKLRLLIDRLLRHQCKRREDTACQAHSGGDGGSAHRGRGHMCAG